MKNVINYYYHLFPNDIHLIDKQYTFVIDKKKYLFKPFNKSLDKVQDIQKVSELLLSRNIKHNQLIKNTFNNILTYVNNIYYILIQINIDDDQCLILEDIISFNNNIYNLINEPFNKNLLKKIWMDKVDYFEYQVNQFGIKYPIIRNSFNYYIGLAENAIMLLNDISDTTITKGICHYRISSKMKLQELYDPTEFILDNKVREFSEFLKSKMNQLIDIELIDYYFKYSYILNDEAILFLSRLLFPTLYFDMCEQILVDSNIKPLENTLKKVSIYEKNLKQIYQYLKLKYKIPNIEWLN